MSCAGLRGGVLIFCGKFDQVVLDYLHTRKFPILGQVAKWGLRGLTAGVLVGVYEFNTNDIGANFRLR